MTTQAPRDTHIPNGPATKVGGLAAAILAVIAGVTSVLHGNYQLETISTLAGAVILLVTIMLGKYHQAAALIKNGGLTVEEIIKLVTEAQSVVADVTGNLPKAPRAVRTPPAAKPVGSAGGKGGAAAPGHGRPSKG
jgi:translation initiation factor IF-2